MLQVVKKFGRKSASQEGAFTPPPKFVFFLGDRGSYLLHCCLGPPVKYTVQTTCGISIGSSVLAQLMDKQIHRDHGASVTLRCIFAFHACDWCGLQCFDAVSIGIWSINTEWWVAGVVICLEWGADLHMAQLIPLPLTVSCFSETQIGFTFLVPAHPGSPGKRAVKRVRACMHACMWLMWPRNTVQ